MEKKAVSLLDFLRAGRLGGVQVGVTRGEVRRLLGEPDFVGAAPSGFENGSGEARGRTWKFGDIELHFGRDGRAAENEPDMLRGIHLAPFKVPTGGKRLMLNPWVIRAGASQQALREALSSASIPFSHHRLETRSPGRLETAAGVRLLFSESGLLQLSGRRGADAMLALIRAASVIDCPEVLGRVSSGHVVDPDLRAELLELATHAEVHVREEAVKALARWPQADAETVFAVAARLRDEDRDVVRAAVDGIGAFATVPPRALHRLGEVLEHPESRMRTAAARALQRLGDQALAAWPALLRLMADGNAPERIAVVQVIAVCGPSAWDNWPTLLEWSRDHNPDVRMACTHALARVGDGRIEAVERLVEMFGDGNERVRGSAADALALLGGCAVTAVPHLTELLQDEAVEVVCAATHALARVGSPETEVLMPVLALLGRPDSRIRADAVEALVRLLPGGRVVQKAVARLRDDPSPTVRQRVRGILCEG